MKQNGLPFFLALTSFTFVSASDKPDANWPFLVFRKGETAHLPCLPQGDSNAFFWRKGPWFNISENVASVVHGIPDTSEKYNVLDDGTLVIKDMTSEDEGKYYCRVASERNECRGSVTVYLEASQEEVDISIEGCTHGSHCVKVLEMSSESQLVCTAKMISESMTLKWYNGTKQIMGDLDVPETGQNGKISNVITFTFEEDSILTCKAEGANVEETTAVIQLRKKEESVSIENEDTSIMLILTIVLGITCVILLGLLISSIHCYRNLKKGQRRTEDNLEMGTGQPKDRERGQETEEVQNMESKGTLETNPPLSKSQEDKEQGESEERKSLLSTEPFEKETQVASISNVKTLQTKLDDLEKQNKELMGSLNELKKRENELKKELEETKEKLRASEKANKELQDSNKKLTREAMPGKAFDKKQQTANVEETLQKELKDTKEKLKTAENAKESFHKELQDTKKKLTKAENDNKISKEELQDIKGKLTTANSSLKDNQNQLTQANEKLGASEKKKEEIQKQLTRTSEKLSASEKEGEITKRQLSQANGKLMASEKEKGSLEKGMQALREKLLTSEENYKQIISNIVQMKENFLHSLPQTRPIAIIGVKGELSKKGLKLDDIMSKPKYHNVLLMSGPSIEQEIVANITDQLKKACYYGTDTYIFLFGRVECGLHNTLHGENDSKGLIERVAHLVFFFSKELKENGLQVNMYVSTASTAGEGKTLRVLSQSSLSNEFETFKIRNGVEITLNKYCVQSEKNLLEIASHMTPNKGYPENDGLLKLTVETLVKGIAVSKGSITIVAITNLMILPNVFKGRLDSNFHEVLSKLVRKRRGDLILVPIVDPALQYEPRKTFEAVKATLDEYR